MCHIFSGQDPSSYAYHTRSVRLGGHSTSIRLEAAFWQILEEIAAEQGVSLALRVFDVVAYGGERGVRQRARGAPALGLTPAGELRLRDGLRLVGARALLTPP